MPNIKQQIQSPLTIVDAIPRKAVEVVVTSPTSDISRASSEVKSNTQITSSSSETDETQQQEELSRQLIELLYGSPKT